MNAYELWIAEVMSQQSGMKTILPYFDRWLKKFPTIECLSAANEDDVLFQWQGLGYYSRARNILKAAKKIKTLANFPRSQQALLEIPGVGPYTAAAIASVGFDEAILPVDGNVIRALARIFLIPDPLNGPHDRKEIQVLASRLAVLTQPGERSDFAQAFMELGATICRPGALAECERCPLQKNCRAFQKRQVVNIPRPKKRSAANKISRLLLLYRGPKNGIWIRKISTGKVLRNQWEIPHLDLIDSDRWVTTKLAQHFELRKPFAHSIMNNRYRVWPVECGPSARPPAPCYKLLPFETADSLKGGVLTTVTRKALKDLQMGVD